MLVAKGTRDEGYLHAERRKERVMKETIRELAAGNETDEENSPDAGEDQPQPAASMKKPIAPGGGTLFHWLKPR